MSDTISIPEAVTIAPTIIPLDLTDIDGLEVCNTEAGQRYECSELGPFTGNRYLRIRCADNVVLAAKLRRLADDLQDATFDERERKIEAERHDCFCGTRLDPGDDTCGRSACVRQFEAEVAYDALGLL